MADGSLNAINLAECSNVLTLIAACNCPVRKYCERHVSTVPYPQRVDDWLGNPPGAAPHTGNGKKGDKGADAGQRRESGPGSKAHKVAEPRGNTQKNSGG